MEMNEQTKQRYVQLNKEIELFMLVDDDFTPLNEKDGDELSDDIVFLNNLFKALQNDYLALKAKYDATKVGYVAGIPQ